MQGGGCGMNYMGYLPGYGRYYCENNIRPRNTRKVKQGYGFFIDKNVKAG
jgi:hypothetical protein